MRSTERSTTLSVGAVLALCLSVSVYAYTPSDWPGQNPEMTIASSNLGRDSCLARGNWYGFYRSDSGLKPICLKLPVAFSVKMLDSNGDGVIDNPDVLSSGVIFTGDDPTLSDIDKDATNTESDSSGGISEGVEKSGGGSRRIMWRQIQ
jgi:hypothetical protein